MIALQSGASTALPITELTIACEWTSSVPDVLACALLLDSAGRVAADTDVLARPEQRHDSGAAEVVSMQPGAAVFRLDLERLPVAIDRVSVCLVLLSPGAAASACRSLRIQVSTGDGEAMAFLPATADMREMALILVEIYRRGDRFRLRADGEGFRDRKRFCEMFGVAEALLTPPVPPAQPEQIALTVLAGPVPIGVVAQPASPEPVQQMVPALSAPADSASPPTATTQMISAPAPAFAQPAAVEVPAALPVIVPAPPIETRHDAPQVQTAAVVSPAPVVAVPASAPRPRVLLDRNRPMIDVNPGPWGLGAMRVDLNWTTPSRGLFGRRRPVDLDLGCLYELADGSKGVIQALDAGFGQFEAAPFIKLDDDDSHGDQKIGQTLRVNGKYWSEIKRIAIFVFIYDGPPDWRGTSGMVTITMSGQSTVDIALEPGPDGLGFCGLVLFDNIEQQLRITRILKHCFNHSQFDKYVNWGLDWMPLPA